MNSKRSAGGVTHFSMIGGLPNFNNANPRNAPKQAMAKGGRGASGAKSANLGFGFTCRSEIQLQQPYLQGQGFLDVPTEPALELLHRLEIGQRFVGGKPLSHLL